ncbi:hypothetical protein MITS9509_01736 [Synechococcus sp. MIT S9509]|nr:hypothetical protein MITS9504_00363 [Synechococcus sp. MIT S9504]KZR92275.1 hypothetical protein MITS9509_01736 [Synechococcus sp. MIT S9509]
MTWFGVPAHMSLYILLGTMLLIGSYFLVNFIFATLSITNSLIQLIICIAIVTVAVRFFVFITKKTWKQSDWDR